MAEAGTYSSVRKRLDQRGYRQPLDVSSLPLVECLLADLVRATDQLNSAQHRHLLHAHHDSGVVTTKSCFGVSRAEHLKVIKENLELRQKMSKLKDENDRETKKAKQKSAGSQRKEMESILDNETSNQLAQSDAYDLGLIQLAEERINQLEADLTAEKAANNVALTELNDVKAEFHEKCNEVERLRNFIDMPRRFDLDFAHHDHFHGHLTHEVCHLHQNNQHLEKKLKEALNACQEEQAKSADLLNRNTLLDSELKDVDRVSQALRRQKEELVRTADHEMNIAKQELERLYKLVQNLETEVSQLRDEKGQVDAHHSNQQKEAMQREIRELQGKVQQACLREQEHHFKLLQLEGAKTSNNNIADVAYLQQVVGSVEKQRDYYKDHLERLNRLTRQQTAPTTTSTPKVPFDAQPGIMEEPIIRLLEEERDFYKIECLKRKGADGRSDGSVDSPSSDSRVVELERELRSLSDEKEELKKTLEQLECVIEETNNCLREVTANRDKLSEALKQAQTSLKAARTNDSQGTFASASAGTFSHFYDMQEERNKAMANLQQVSSDLDDARNRFKLATQTQVTERTRMEKIIADLKSKLLLESGERAEFLSKISSQKLLMDSMEEQLQVLQNHLKNAEKELHRAQIEADQAKTLVEQTETSLKEVKSRLTQKASDNSQVDRRILDYERRIEHLNQVIGKQKDDLLSLQRSVVALDHDKDVLQMEVDNKAENMAAVQQELLIKSNDLTELKTTISNLESRIDRLLDDLHTKDMDMKVIQRQLDAAERETRTTKRDYDDMLDKNRQLQEDLAVMTRENQVICEDLKKSRDDRDNLRVQLQNYVAEVSHVEELLQSRERERTDLLEQYHSLTSATSNLELHNSVLEGQASSVRLELLSKESELSHAKQSVDTLNREIEEYFQRQQQSEGELADLRRNLNDSDTKFFAVQRERERLERDLAAMRDLCTRLDANKEKLVEQISNKDSELEKVQMSADEQRLEAEHLRSQLSSQHTVVESLEELLASNRQQAYHTQLKNRELNTELTTLKNRLSDVESKLQEQTRIAARYRGQISDFEDEVEKLQRKLTSERFERERLNQELKRSQKSMSPTVISESIGSKIPSSDMTAASGSRVRSTSVRTDFISTKRTVAEPFSNQTKADPRLPTSDERGTPSPTSSSKSLDNNH